MAVPHSLRKFVEGQGQSAGEFYTPREVAIVMARFLDPKPGETVYDPCCGSGGLLIKCHLRLLETKGKKSNGRLQLPSNVAPLRLFGQEINSSTFAMSRMNAFLHGMEAEIALGDTMHRPAFTEGDGRLRQFDLVTANPMWNQKFDAANYENDTYERFKHGFPPSSSADWGWVQHMAASLNDAGRMAVVLDTGAVSRGSGNQGSNKERDIRKQFVEADLVEAVLLLPENLFYNTTAPGIVMVINKRNARYWEGGTIPWLTSAKVYDRVIRAADEFVTEVARHECHLPLVPKGSLVVAIMGQGKTLGNTAILAIDACVSQHLAYMTFNTERLIPEYALAYLRSRYDELQSVSRSGGSTKGALTCGYLRGFCLPVPPSTEQCKIVEYLSALDAKQMAEEGRKCVLDSLFRSLLHELMTGQVRLQGFTLGKA